MLNIPQLQDCWAKTYPIGHPRAGTPGLTVHGHSLTVGYVAQELIKHLPPSVAQQLPKGTPSLIAAHDIGKLTPGFQLKCPLWTHYEQISQTINRNSLCTNHAILSHWHLQSILPRPAQRWLTSTAGHHGNYPFGNRRQSTPPSEGGNQTFIALREELLAQLIEIFGPLPDEPSKHQEERIHLLTGLTIFSDWMGSNTDWFPLDEPIDAESIQVQTRAIQSRLGRTAAIIPNLTFGQQFSPHKTEKFRPRTIQSELLELVDGRGLYIIEAPMGMGKTEAALTAAYQLWENHHNHGLYFALPTQLTSNKIHDRITDFLINTIGEESVQTLIHGSAWLKNERTQQLTPPQQGNGSDLPDLDHNDTEEVHRWYSSTRKALLAPFGTGTIDQALLAVLPARFAALRYFALAGKVVIIDEVHSYDPYMSTLIDRLIRHLLKAGSTVIILSATLTAERRRQLVKATGASEPPAPTSYPLITKVATDQALATHHPSAAKLPSQTIHLDHQTLTAEDELAYWQKIADLAQQGANVVIIRNTVTLAQQTYNLLKSIISEQLAPESVGLIHSRFPQWQREENEALWTQRLGKGDQHRPHGSLLVSTQILEQSVDIDADLLITDLAPIELILQRIGRLHRHSRQSRPKSCREAHCHLLHPPTTWQENAKEIEEKLAPHHYIYPPISLWRAQTYLQKTESLNLPQEIRQTLEETAELTPDFATTPALEQFLKEHQKAGNDQTGTAKVRGVFSMLAIQDLEGSQTRYRIQPSANLILLRKAPEVTGNSITLHPFHVDPENPQTSYSIREGMFSHPLARVLHLNAARISQYLVKDMLPQAPNWLGQHIDTAVLAVVSDDGTELEFYPEHHNPLTLHYHPTTGISHQRNTSLPLSFEQEEDWY
ncbi:CRISPR-associated helicase Cas3' [Roseibacillus persicicus]|uniref:CRISPR-associated helicase Cas3' n=1 Tax=Roseibacillus persicicus TaxID=454148 RepID=UPI00280D6EF6|nr:CRISPR-associated helicase Cas3' [Roseibacillus persicicus]MDQ8189676.1 CRISPR-associated helicase Cas3' [Roseibacillus persicicus]